MSHKNVRIKKFIIIIIIIIIKLLNKDENISVIANKVFHQTFYMFKSTLKNKVIISYNDKCIDPNNCVSCKRMALNVHGVVGVDVVDGVDGVDAIHIDRV